MNANSMLWHIDTALDRADETTGTVVGITEINDNTAVLTHYLGLRQQRFTITITEVD